MIQYLVILLDDTCVSYCHYKNRRTKRFLIPLDTLRKGIVFGMKENCLIQFVLPNYKLPEHYWDVMMSIDHSIIVPGEIVFEETIPQNMPCKIPDVVVFNSLDDYKSYQYKQGQTYVLRVEKSILFNHYREIIPSLSFINRLNIIITNIDSFNNDDFTRYAKILSVISDGVMQCYCEGKSPQLNIVTDRMMLTNMNNCNAGVNSISLAPDGRFYICPAFYQDNSNIQISRSYDVGSLDDGINIKNANLYKIECAPICRKCDAYQCKRCIWLNRKLTYEINTPSHEQCVISHIERNAGRILLDKIRTQDPSFLEGQNIEELHYLDPYELREQM